MLAFGPNRHTIILQQPPRGATINWRDALTSNLRFYCPLSQMANSQDRARDLVTGDVGVSVPLSSFSTDTTLDLGKSVGTRTDSTNNNITWTGAAYPMTAVTTSPMTIATKLCLLATSAVFSTIFGHMQLLSTNGYMLRKDNTNLPLFHQNNNATTGSLALSVGQWVTLFGTWNGNTQRLYMFDQRGAVLSSNTGSFTGPVLDAAGGRVAFFNLGSGDSDNTICAIEWGGIWLRELALSECAKLARNPYSILLPPGANVFVPAIFKVAAGAPPPTTVFRKTLSGLGTAVGKRQPHAWP